MDIDLLLAIAHHLTVFTLVGLFAAEFALLRPGLSGATIGRLARIDAVYGVMAGLVIVVGVIRVMFGASGWAYYLSNAMFWAKMVAFLIMGLLTIPPTIAIRQWVGALKADWGFVPTEADIRRNRRYVHLQAMALLFVPIFAAAMARGYGVV